MHRDLFKVSAQSRWTLKGQLVYDNRIYIEIRDKARLRFFIKGNPWVLKSELRKRLTDVTQRGKEQLSFPQVFSGNPEKWMPDKSIRA